MEDLSLEQLISLGQLKHSPSISIFLPTSRLPQDTQKNLIRFKNLLGEAEQSLKNVGMKPRQVKEFLEPAQELLVHTYIWKHQYDGLAVFINAEDYYYYRLPFPVEKQMMLSGSFYIKPILPLYTITGHYYILALSQKQVRLFEGTQHNIGQIDLPEGTPVNLDDFLKLDDPQSSLQFHTGTTQGGLREGMYHGHVFTDKEKKILVDRYVNRVEAHVSQYLTEHPAPLVLACVDYLLPMFRKASDYWDIIPTGIDGNPEHLDAEDLHKASWPLVEPRFRSEINNTIAKYQQDAMNQKATDLLHDILLGAHAGRVDRLLLASGAQIWGDFDPETGKTCLGSDGKKGQNHVELIDLTAVMTLQTGGKVFVLSQEEMPSDSPSAAIFRY